MGTIYHPSQGDRLIQYPLYYPDMMGVDGTVSQFMLIYPVSPQSTLGTHLGTAKRHIQKHKSATLKLSIRLTCLLATTSN